MFRNRDTAARSALRKPVPISPPSSLSAGGDERLPRYRLLYAKEGLQVKREDAPVRGMLSGTRPENHPPEGSHLQRAGLHLRAPLCCRHLREGKKALPQHLSRYGESHPPYLSYDRA